jgi:hypothetical protein
MASSPSCPLDSLDAELRAKKERGFSDEGLVGSVGDLAIAGLAGP